MKNINIGSTVEVTAQADDTCSIEYLGKIGKVTEINGNEQTGNTLLDPLYNVTFPDGTKDHFWNEELTVIDL